MQCAPARGFLPWGLLFPLSPFLVQLSAANTLRWPLQGSNSLEGRGMEWSPDPQTNQEVMKNERGDCYFVQSDVFSLLTPAHLSFWIRSSRSAGRQVVICWWLSPDVSTSLVIDSNNIWVEPAGGGNSGQKLPMSPGEWHHVVVVIVPNAVVSLSLDGGLPSAWQNPSHGVMYLLFGCAVTITPTGFPSVSHPIHPDTFATSFLFSKGEEACSPGTSYYEGSCIGLAPPGDCSKPFSIHGVWDSYFSSRYGVGTGDDFALGLSLSPDRTSWLWDDGTHFDYVHIWCGDQLHHVNYFSGSGNTCETSQKPSNPPKECAAVMYASVGAGASDVDCGVASSLRTLCVFGMAPPTQAPPTTAAPTVGPSTPLLHTAVPGTALPPSDAPTSSVPTPLGHVSQAPAPGFPALPSAASLVPAFLTPAPASPAHTSATPASEVPVSVGPASPAHTSTAPASPEPAVPASPVPALAGASLSLPPETAAPVSRRVEIPAGQKKAIATVNTIAAVTLPGGALARALLLKGFTCQVEDVDLAEAEHLDWEFHPTRVSLGTGRRRYMLGAALLNQLLIVAMLGVLFFAASFVHWYSSTPWLRALGIIRAPGLGFIPYMFLIQGSSLVSFRLAFYPNGLGDTVVGWYSLLVCMASPALLYRLVYSRVPHEASGLPDPKLFGKGAKVQGRKAALYKTAFGKIVWVSNDPDSYFVERYGVFFEPYRPGCTSFPLAEITTMLGLSILSAWQPTDATACNSRNTLICVLFLVLTCSFAYYRPFSSFVDNAIAQLLSGGMLTAVILMTYALWAGLDPENTPYVVAGHILFWSAVIVFLKSMWDLAVYSTDICVGRRRTAREVVKAMKEKEALGNAQEELLPIATKGKSDDNDFDFTISTHLLPKKDESDMEEMEEEESEEVERNSTELPLSVSSSNPNVPCFTPPEQAFSLPHVCNRNVSRAFTPNTFFSTSSPSHIRRQRTSSTTKPPKHLLPSSTPRLHLKPRGQ